MKNHKNKHIYITFLILTLLLLVTVSFVTTLNLIDKMNNDVLTPGDQVLVFGLFFGLPFCVIMAWWSIKSEINQ